MNELNDLLDLETFPMDCLDHLNFPRFIHGVKLAVTDFKDGEQPRIKHIYCLYQDKSITQPIYSHSFDPFFMTPSNLQPLVCSPDVFRLSTLWSHTSTESYSGVTLPSVTPIHNKRLLYGLYIIQISNNNFIGMIRV